MRIHERVVIDIATGVVLEEEGYEYEGLVAECKGGGNAGKIDFPEHMKNAHKQWLNHNGSDAVSYSMVDLMNTAWSNDTPFTNASAYNPDTNITTFTDSGTALQDLVDTLSLNTGLDEFAEDILSDDAIQAETAAFAAIFDADLAANVYPRFEAGMRDINSVTSSAFAIGRANIEVARDREVAKFDSGLRMRRATDSGLRLVELKLQYQQAVTTLITEQQRLAIVAKKEQNDYEVELDSLEAKWDIGIYEAGANLLGSIGGGGLIPQKTGPNPAASALGGAVSGAAAGSSFGGVGAVVGAVVGGVAGYMSAQ